MWLFLRGVLEQVYKCVGEVMFQAHRVNLPLHECDVPHVSIFVCAYMCTVSLFI